LKCTWNSTKGACETPGFIIRRIYSDNCPTIKRQKFLFYLVYGTGGGKSFSGMDMSKEEIEGRLPKEVTEWHPPGRRKRGRPKLSWAEGIRGLMGEKGLMEEEWNDRSNWRKKIKYRIFL
jgi:hypothetical protein